MFLRKDLCTIALGSCVLAPGVIAAPLHAQSATVYADAPAQTRYEQAIDHARLIVRAMMTESRTPGASVAVGVNGEVVWAEGFGYADAENRAAVWQETRFRIGSVSKPLTAAAVARLYEAGRLDLDAPIQSYVPSFPEKRWPITTRQVAGHLAGIRHYRGEEFLSSKRYGTVLEGLEIFQNDTLVFEPGTRFSYSSHGWNLISAVVEGASEEEFLTYMKENVFDPLGMRNTAADHTDSIISHRTRFYHRNEDGRVLNAPYVDNSYKWAGGGFLSTPEDLVRFGMAHLSEEYLQPETIEMMWTSQRTSAGEETGNGIGWFVGTDPDGRRTVFHGGGSFGGTTQLLLLPDEGVVVAIVGNMTQAPNTYTEAWTIAEPFLKQRSEILSGSPLDIAGAYACSAEFRGEDVLTGTIEMMASPKSYLGQMSWSNDTVDRILYSSARRGETRLTTVDGTGRLTIVWFTEKEGDKLEGRWFSGGMTGSIDCTGG
jgi:CubicO group peptidase (beta-lactamase class C family)